MRARSIETRGKDVYCVAAKCAIDTPACFQAIRVRPEQSKVSGPAAAKTYGLPSCAIVYATASLARGLGGTGSASTPEEPEPDLQVGRGRIGRGLPELEGVADRALHPGQHGLLGRFEGLGLGLRHTRRARIPARPGRGTGRAAPERRSSSRTDAHEPVDHRLVAVGRGRHVRAVAATRHEVRRRQVVEWGEPAGAAVQVGRPAADAVAERGVLPAELLDRACSRPRSRRNARARRTWAPSYCSDRASMRSPFASRLRSIEAA